MAGFHHGISAQEVKQGILPMRNANVSVLGLIVTSTDADDTMYPVGTPVLLTGITQDNIDKAGTDGTLRDCLQTIRDIHNPTVVILRVSESFDADSLDILLTCPTRFGLMPKRFGAPELDTPDVVLKLVSIAKRRRGIVYASPRKPDGTLITDKADIVAYRDTYGDREIVLIDGEWGLPGTVAAGFDWSSLSLNDIVVLDGNSDGLTNFEAEINGKIYNKDGASGDLNNALYDLNIMNIGGGSYEDQGHIVEIYNLSPEILNVKLTALPSQMNTTTKFIDGTGVVLDGNVFLFRLAVNPR